MLARDSLQATHDGSPYFGTIHDLRRQHVSHQQHSKARVATEEEVAINLLPFLQGISGNGRIDDSACGISRNLATKIITQRAKREHLVSKLLYDIYDVYG
mmetsp:Transcript_14717/g.21185  ORF Transcript_14717/g.21185 Transcript_14717/m.21185 type:complete len:100 (+) Transcript_14717:445-744(+)